MLIQHWHPILLIHYYFCHAQEILITPIRTDWNKLMHLTTILWLTTCKKSTWYLSSISELYLLFCFTLGMPWHAWLHPLKITEYIWDFYTCLTTYKNASSNFNLFMRYCNLKNPVFWLLLRFLGSNSKTKDQTHMSRLNQTDASIND